MAEFMLNDPEHMRDSGNKTDACSVEIAGQLRQMNGTQNELAAVFSSPGAGTALQTALTEANAKGRALLQTLDEIVISLKQAGVDVDASDNEARSTISAAAGGSGGVTTATAGVGSGNKIGDI
ncbi:WXG100 family type VII secretion target [Nocardia brasiliensis]|uniref:WXG100 family type VII secretion target n=1 Tax=Nocardia brasiliensis TaxID=37326 RepID=UPI003D8EE0FF